jgi:hypothetical protein
MKERAILAELKSLLLHANDEYKIHKAVNFYRQNRRFICASEEVWDLLKSIKKEDLKELFLSKKKAEIGLTVRSRLTGKLGKIINLKKDGFTIEVKWDEGGSQILPIDLLYVVDKKEEAYLRKPLAFGRLVDYDRSDIDPYKGIGNTPKIFNSRIKKEASAKKFYVVYPFSRFVDHLASVEAQSGTKYQKDDIITMLCAQYDLPETSLKRSFFSTQNKPEVIDTTEYPLKYVACEICFFPNGKEALLPIYTVDLHKPVTYVAYSI